MPPTCTSSPLLWACLYDNPESWTWAKHTKMKVLVCQHTQASHYYENAYITTILSHELKLLNGNQNILNFICWAHTRAPDLREIWINVLIRFIHVFHSNSMSYCAWEFMQEQVAEEFETGKMYRASFTDKFRRPVIVMIPRLQVCLPINLLGSLTWCLNHIKL